MLTIETKPGVTLGFVDTRELPLGGYGFIPQIWLSEITEEQAKELTPQLSVHVPEQMRSADNEWKDYTGKELIKMAALSMGIKEKDFDKYLVIKL